jgi:predicted small lipoprotein YifL
MSLRTLMALLALCAVAAACGQKGALVRPEPSSATVISKRLPSETVSP